MSDLRIPVSTYRLQFNARFTFRQALELVAYFQELGITDFYASPVMKAQSGSLHGYDVVDYDQINPEIGTEEELGQLATTLQEKGMGLLLDIVPNHMSVGDAKNKWWNDVLENGPSSVYANYFNIIWDPPKAELKNKILLPVLDQKYGNVIENQEIKIIYEGGAFLIDYKGLHLPVNPRTWTLILEPIAKEMELKWGDSHSDMLELQSVLTALNHLPGITETDPEKSKERNREKEIIKKRLAALLENTSILEAVQHALTLINGQKGNPHSFDLLEELLDKQAYRLSYWRVTNDEINYRRFFDVSTLASMRVEEEETFQAIHAFIFKLIKQHWITGLRIDHIDGLFDPENYLKRLQIGCKHVLHENEEMAEARRDFYVIAEKILGGEEKLCPQWLLFGTTGYDYLNLVNGVFVVTEHQVLISELYERFAGRQDDMEEVIYNSKKLILIVSMSSELHILARQLEEVAEQHRSSRDYTLESLRFALREVIACFPVYRSYIRAYDNQVSEEDKRYILSAVQQAKRLNPAMEPSIFDFIETVLLLQDPEGLTGEQIHYRRNFVMRFQQLTGPVTAKGVEDTAFYRYYPLASLNEVGMDPERFGVSVEEFHKKNQERGQQWPHTLLATFTHDTKRSEDVRARINVLSENAEGWRQALYRWQDYNSSKKIRLNKRNVPDNNEEYLLYQTLIGSWPLYPMDASARAQYIDRIDKYMNKALKEAKIHTSWINVNEEYEKGVQGFIHKILAPDSSNRFLTDFINYVRPIMRAGLFNSLAQILLKMTTPGIPDFYQGSELWEFTLVDPDNRRPVDYSNRRHLLQELKEQARQDCCALVSQLMETPEDGLIKLYLTMQGLGFRRDHADLFQYGDYVPLQAAGEKSRHIIAFSRTKDEHSLVVVVGRFYTQLLDISSSLPLGQEVWKDTHVLLSQNGIYRDVLSGLEFTPGNSHSLSIAQLFSKLPLVLLEKIKG